MAVRETTKASKWETLGAWLRIWTPPRDVVVPPVPWRRIGMGAALLAMAVVAAVLLLAPRIDDAKEETAEREQRTQSLREAAQRAQTRFEQRARFGRLAAGASFAEGVRAVEAAVGRDAKERFVTDGRPAVCEPAAGEDPAAPRVGLACDVVVREIVAGGEQEGVQGALTIPYRAVLDVGARRFAFCKVNPPPGEQLLADPRSVEPLPKACGG
ncbi:MAG TPA: hypothetical protein VHF89_13520 [Solirubrobacteraceae bacterium]|nr:hypothetical protein [Solirubrobacteraceae bacterium]